MDSVTQIALGAAVGEATLGRQTGRRAWMWGAFCGLFPDLDILYPFNDAVKAFTYHRGPSHSLFVLAALTPLFAWLILRLHPQTARYRTRWYVLIYLVFVTHVLLDCLTVYGTQIFWPLGTPPVMWSTIFIIDPVYSVPLFAAVLAALMVSRKRSWGRVANTVGLVLSTIYLMWTVGAKIYVTDIAHQSLKEQGIAYQQMLTIPGPLNSLLWRVLAMDDTGYFEGFYSILDHTKDVLVKHYPSEKSLLKDMADQWPVKRLKWFTHGFYSVGRVADDIVITDLRMGLEPFYVFQFNVGQAGNPRAKATRTSRMKGERRWDQLRWVWQRIWTAAPDTSLTGDHKTGVKVAASGS
ncbi:MAG: metal-dependent hydrolase [Thermodesulfobacteriota bacterium]|nr:metal-dependent hydrolase [Thermodesulfobacteriota bacterium]